jgi:hypothetical protein
MYNPSYIVKRFGLDEVFKKVCTKLNGGEFTYSNSSNIASDAFLIGTDSHERLKVSSLIIGNYIKSGKFRELLEATYNVRKIKPL